jgi:hypothetical protein
VSKGVFAVPHNAIYSGACRHKEADKEKPVVGPTPRTYFHLDANAPLRARHHREARAHQAGARASLPGELALAAALALYCFTCPAPGRRPKARLGEAVEAATQLGTISYKFYYKCAWSLIGDVEGAWGSAMSEVRGSNVQVLDMRGSLLLPFVFFSHRLA